VVEGMAWCLGVRVGVRRLEELAIPVYGTRPVVGLRPTMPLQQHGRRIEPPWSPPIPRSTSPRATRTAVADEEPPAEKPGEWTLSIRPGAGQPAPRSPISIDRSHR
jgi:hypothetical protein